VMNSQPAVQTKTKSKPTFIPVASGLLQRAAINSSPVHEVPSIVNEVLRSPGQPLDAQTRAFMEPRFGHDFSHVRVHTDERAAESARSVYARAYTVGSHVVFGPSELAPRKQQNHELLAHELAHTVQQLSGMSVTPPSNEVFEKSAESAGRDIANDRSLSTKLPASAIGLARAPVPIEEYPDDLLAKRLAEVRERLKEKSYPGRDEDVHMESRLKQIVNKRERDVAVSEALAFLKSTEVEEPEPPQEKADRLPAKFYPGGFTDEDIDPGAKQREEAERKRREQEALRRKQEEESRPERLNTVRRYLTLHSVPKRNMADLLTSYLTVDDLRVLRKNGLEPPGFFTSKYSDKVIAVIDKIVPRDPEEDLEDKAELRRRYADIQRVAGKIESMKNEGGTGFAGRVIGATTAGAARLAGYDYDIIASGDLGSSLGSTFGFRGEIRSVASLNRPIQEPISTKPIAAEPAPSVKPLLPPRSNITFPRGTDVTQRGQFPASGVQPAVPVAPPATSGGPVKVTRYPEGYSGANPPTPMRLAPDPVTARPTGNRSASDADIISQPGMREQYRAYPSKPQHHVFPQELESWFKERFKGTREDIHQYTLYLSEGEHQAIHKSGKGGVAKGVQEPDLKGWNQEWKDFKRNHPTASPQQIFEEAGRLMDKYKVSAAEIAPYKGKK
jgi:hypothetical protein